MARIIIPGLFAGGACGAGVGFGLYPAVAGVAGSVAVGLVAGLLVYRSRRPRTAD